MNKALSYLRTSQPAFRLLLPVGPRRTISYQHFPEIPSPKGGVGFSTDLIRGSLEYTTPELPVAGSVTVEVDNNNFSALATLSVGTHRLTSNSDYVVGGTDADTATNLAAAIDAIQGVSASAVGTTITVTGATGLQGLDFQVTALYRGSIQNFTITPLTGAEPSYGPPVIT